MDKSVTIVHYLDEEHIFDVQIDILSSVVSFDALRLAILSLMLVCDLLLLRPSTQTVTRW